MLVYDTALGKLSGADVLAFADAEEDETHEGEEEGHDEEETVNPVLPTGGDIIYAAVFFFALWAALKYVLLPPVQKVRAERAQKIADARDAADNASADMGSAQADYDAALADARTEAARIVEEARGTADSRRAEVMAAAETDAGAVRAAAADEVTAARTQAMETLRSDVATVAAGAASTVLGRQIDPSSAQDIADRALQGGNS